MLGVARAARRSRDCSWLLDNDGDDLDGLRGVTGTLLASNPCSEAARAEMQAGSEDEQAQLTSLTRAMSILLSDDCQVVEPEQAEEVEDVEGHLEQAEDEMQDRLNELV